jgi:ABC-type amino acid transport substrate-binding protein
MGKVIIDTKMIGINFMTVVFREAYNLAVEKGLDTDKIGKELAEASAQEDFMEIIKKYFGDELIILF